MIIFDNENTLLESSFIKATVAEFNFKNQFAEIVKGRINSFTRTKTIAKLLKYRSFEEILKVVDKIQLLMILHLLFAN